MKIQTSHSRLKRLCNSTIDRAGPWGTHSLRKTGYLVALWGGGVVEQLMLSARHSTIKSASRYYQDAETLLAMARRRKSATRSPVTLVCTERRLFAGKVWY